MKYVAMVYGNQEKWAAIMPEDMAEGIARVDAFNKKYAQTGELLGAWGLGEPAQLVRRAGGAPVVTDGPYQEVKEYIASFFMLDCVNLQRAQEIVAEWPFADVEPVELWPVLHEAAEDV